MKKKMALKVSSLAVPFVIWSLAAFADDVPKVDIHGVIVVSKPATQENGFHFPEQRTRIISLPNGGQMPLREFMLTYCQGKYTNETCARGSKILSIDSSSGPREKLPAGL